MKTARAGFGSDLAVVALAVAGTVAVTTYPVVRETPLRVPFAFAFVLFLPGYALVAAGFPERYGRDGESTRLFIGGIGPIERIVLSVAVSIAAVILVGIVLVFSPVGFVFSAVLLSLSGVTLSATLLAAWRRGRLPSDERYSIALSDLAITVPTDSPADAALSVLLVVSIVAVGGVVVADALAPTGPSSADLFVLAPNGSGQPMADNYTTTLTRGRPQPIVIGVTNPGETSKNYTVVTVLQRLSATNDTVRTVSETRLDTFTLRVGANETVRERRAVVPPVVGPDLRLAFLLYRGQPPSHPTVENAYREVHLFVNVTVPNADRGVTLEPQTVDNKRDASNPANGSRNRGQ